jgi:acylphosphatase
MRTVHVQVLGRVQGVGFRWFVRERARRRGLAGWVRNNPDGTLELVASGADPDIRRFLDEVRDGPAGARVEELRSLPTEALGSLPNPFDIRH